MKTALLAWLTPLLLVVVQQTPWLRYLDFDNPDYDITWDDITSDLW